MTRGGWLTALVALVAALPLTAAPASARAFTLVTTADGDPIHWRHRCVELWSHTRLSGDVDADAALDIYAEAAAVWTAVDCTWLQLAVRGFTCFDDVGLPDGGRAQNVLTWHEEPGSWPHAERVVALTSVTYDRRTGEIVDADIELNGEDYRFGVDGARDRYDLQQTLTHELGHVLGLDHSERRSATMYALSYAGETRKRELTDDDIAGLCTSHPMPDAPTGGSCKDVPVRELDDPWCPAPTAKGCAATGGAPIGGLAALLLTMAVAGSRRRRHLERQRSGRWVA